MCLYWIRIRLPQTTFQPTTFPTSARSTSNRSTTFNPTATVSLRGRTVTPTTASIQTSSFLFKTLSFMFTTTLPNIPLSSVAPPLTTSSSRVPPSTSTSTTATVATLPGSTTSSIVISSTVTSSIVTSTLPLVTENSATDNLDLSTTTKSADSNSSTTM